VILAENAVDHALKHDHFGLTHLSDEGSALQEFLLVYVVNEYFVV